MAEAGLHGADQQRRRPLSTTEDLTQCVRLLRIANAGAGRVRFHIDNVFGRNARLAVHLSHELDLTIRRRREYAYIFK
jgi:hypothetical protein